jgi:hypothetical protein
MRAFGQIGQNGEVLGLDTAATRRYDRPQIVLRYVCDAGPQPVPVMALLAAWS